MPVRTILGGLPLLAERQSAYHALHQDWRLSEIVFPNPELGLEDKIRALRRLPPGPAVSITIVPDELVSRFYAITFTDSTDMVRRANALRARADPSVKPRLIILYPPAADKGIIDFWLAAFGSAAGRGPRMLAALLYEAPPGTFEGIEDEVRSLLASLKTWPIA